MLSYWSEWLSHHCWWNCMEHTLAGIAILDDPVLQTLGFVLVPLSLTAALLEKWVLAKKQQLALLEE